MTVNAGQIPAELSSWYPRFFHAALDRGVDFLDSSDLYGWGQNETLLGRALKGRRKGAVVATKFGQVKLTGGGRWYDFKETRDFISGGIFSNGDTRIGDKTKSHGFSPRAIATACPPRPSISAASILRTKPCTSRSRPSLKIG